MDSANGEATTGAKRPFESANLEEEQGSNEILESSKVQAMPLKRFFRSRAHCNPLSHNDGFHYPLSPVSAGDRMICRNIFFDGSISKLSWLELGRSRRWVTLFVSAIVNSFKNMTTFSGWSLHYPLITDAERTVKFLDVGMGFGGLTVALAELYPEKLVLGMEIRAKVCEYVRLRISALRGEQPGKFQNAAALRTNCMRYLPNFFVKNQLEKVFFCFPDPHFKAKNHRRRIISDILLTEYAYFLEPNGRLYTVTDVEELHKWHVAKCTAHPYFERIPDDECLASDPSVNAMLVQTEEGIKVARLGGNKYFAVFRRRQEDELPKPQLSLLWDSENTESQK